MKKRKLRGYVIPTICFMLITTILFSSYKMYQILMISRNNTIKETIEPVVKEEEENVTPTINETKSIIRPYNQNTVVAQIPFYDADATEVNVVFKDTSNVGGTLIISDNGEGMDREQLQNGFMRLSSADKIQ